MTKEIICICMLFVLGGCAGNKTSAPPLNSPPPSLNLGSAEHPAQVLVQWSKKMTGAISDLSFSKDGKRILVATSPDRDIETSVGEYRLTLLDAKGHEVWRQKMKYPVKDQALSVDGSFVVISNYENQLMGLDHRGRTLWTIETMCRPHIVQEAQRILCYHDDDAEPRVGFDVFDWKGKKVYSYPIQQDILAFKISKNEKNVALALDQGRVVLLDSNYRPVWEKQVKGEVVDVAVSADESPWVAALYQSKGKAKQVKLFDYAGNEVGELQPSFRAFQLEFDLDRKNLFYYGNSSEGQWMSGFSLKEMKEVWRHGTLAASDYSSSITLTPSGVLMGFEEINPAFRKSHVVFFDSAGSLKADLLLPSDEGSYLYSHRVAAASPLVVVGTDDASLSLFRIE